MKLYRKDDDESFENYLSFQTKLKSAASTQRQLMNISVDLKTPAEQHVVRKQQFLRFQI